MPRETLAKVLPFKKDKPLSEVPVVSTLDYSVRVGLEMPMDCKPCSMERLKLLAQYAIIWEQRFGDNLQAARDLLMERVVCRHPADNSDIESRIAGLLARQRQVTIELPE